MFKKLPRPSARFILAAGLVSTLSVILFSSEFLGAWLCEKFIRKNGFPEARVSDFSLSPSGFFIDSLSLDRSEFSTANGLSVQLNWIDFIAYHRIASIEIKGISLAGEMSSNGQYKIAGWDASVPKFSTAQEDSGAGVSSVLIDGINRLREHPVKRKNIVSRKVPNGRSKFPIQLLGQTETAWIFCFYKRSQEEN